MYVAAVTIEITFTLAENVKKIRLLTKKVCAAVSATAASLKLVSISTSAVSFNAMAYVIRCVMGFLFFPHSTDSN